MLPGPMPFPLRHFWPLGLVALAVVAGAAAVYLQTRPETLPEDPGLEAVLAEAPLADSVASTPLLVFSEPAGASIEIDGEPAGATPLLVENVAIGLRQVRLQLAGHAPVDTLLSVEPGASLRVVLASRQARPAAPAPAPEAAPLPAAAPASPVPAAVPAAPAAPGRVAVSVRPWGTISIDGQILRRDADVTVETALAAGTHWVVVEHPVLGQQGRTVTVRSGQTTRLAFDLNAPRPR